MSVTITATATVNPANPADQAAPTSPIPSAQQVGGPAMVRGLLPSLVRDIGAPTAAYYGLHALGVSDWGALLAGALVSGCLLVAEAIKARRLEIFSGFMLGVFTIGLLSALVSGDPRFLIVKDSFGTGLLAAAFLISAVIGKPLVYYAARRFAGERAAEMEARYAASPGMRRGVRLSSVIWGVGLLTEAIVRIPLAYSLPVSTMAGLSQVLMIGTIGTLMTVNIVVMRRGIRRAAQA
ncbi:MAG TPA: VC0807 family protein, partial [Pseudonocardiaceae bacterium]|nr:VC0807 family protein [Pseudonocardiaceae bacterium]